MKTIFYKGQVTGNGASYFRTFETEDELKKWLACYPDSYRKESWTVEKVQK